MDDKLIMALLAIRAGVDEALSLLGYEEKEEKESKKECTHPPNKRIDMSTMGNEEWVCSLCGYRYKVVKK